MRTAKFEWGSLITFNEEEFKVYKKGSKWVLHDRPFDTLKEVKDHIQNPDTTRIVNEVRVGLWDCVQPEALLALEYASKPLTEQVRNTLDCFGLITPEGLVDTLSAERQRDSFVRQYDSQTED